MENIVNKIWMSFKKEVFNEFKFEDYILLLKIRYYQPIQ